MRKTIKKNHVNQKLLWPNVEIEWWYFFSLVDGPGGRYGIIMMLVKQIWEDSKVRGIHSLIGKYHGGFMVHGYAALIDMQSQRYRYIEETSPFKKFSGDIFMRPFTASLGDWQSELLNDVIQIQLPFPETPVKLDAFPLKEKTKILGGTKEEYVAKRADSIGWAYPRLKLSGGIGADAYEGEGYYECVRSRLNPRNLMDLSYTWIYCLFDDNTELLVFVAPWEYEEKMKGFFIDADGKFEHLSAEDYTLEESSLWQSPRTSATYPVAWEFECKKLGMSCALKASFPDQELEGKKILSGRVWLGIGAVVGIRNKKSIKGVIYVGMSREQRFLHKMVLSAGDIWFRNIKKHG